MREERERDQQPGETVKESAHRLRRNDEVRLKPREKGISALAEMTEEEIFHSWDEPGPDENLVGQREETRLFFTGLSGKIFLIFQSILCTNEA